MKINAARSLSLDIFRGFSILLMILFTIGQQYSSDSALFKHNNIDQFAPGDFVLPIFLFASGLSIPFFIKKREQLDQRNFILDCAERFFKILGVGFLLSPLTSGTIFGMDEVVLNAILFGLSMLLFSFSEMRLFIVTAIIFTAHTALSYFGILPISLVDYLGGYGTAIFYLPIMLAGIIIGKKLAANQQFDFILVYFFFFIFLISSILYYPDKISASASFMSISILVAYSLFCLIIKFVEHREYRSWSTLIIPILEYCGKRSLRFWVLMLLFPYFAVGLYAYSAGIEYPFKFPFYIGLSSALLSFGLVYLLSLTMDEILKRIIYLRRSKG